MHAPVRTPWVTMRVMNLPDSAEPLRFSWRGSAAPFFIVGGYAMPDYEQLYHMMVHASEAAIAALQTGNVWDAQRILIEAERAAEERYIESGD